MRFGDPCACCGAVVWCDDVTARRKPSTLDTKPQTQNLLRQHLLILPTTMGLLAVRFINESLCDSSAWLNADAPIADRAVPAHVASSVGSATGAPSGVATTNLSGSGGGFCSVRGCLVKYRWGVKGGGGGGGGRGGKRSRR